MKLYKFRTVDTNSLTSLANNQLWFSSLNDFNDPFEGAHVLNDYLPKEILSTFKCKSKEEIGEESYKTMLSEMGLQEGGLTNEALFQKIAEHDLSIFISIIHNSKIACFSLSDEQKDPIKENLMWSHYADGLRGFCLVFNDKKLQDNFNSSTNKTMRPIQVAYQNKPNTLSLADFVQSEGILDNSGDSYVQTVTETIATKSDDWEYENELRILALDDSDFHSYAPESLIEIVIGEKMPSVHRKLIIDIAKNNNPKIIVKEACLMSNSYNIEIVDYER